MLSTAGFPAYDPSGTPTAFSRPIVQGLLRATACGFDGVTITDALGTPTGHDEVTAGVLAARAGADVLLYTDSAPGELAALQRALATGALSCGRGSSFLQPDRRAQAPGGEQLSDRAGG